jgi:hypothetical protein
MSLKKSMSIAKAKYSVDAQDKSMSIAKAKCLEDEQLLEIYPNTNDYNTPIIPLETEKY